MRRRVIRSRSISHVLVRSAMRPCYGMSSAPGNIFLLTPVATVRILRKLSRADRLLGLAWCPRVFTRKQETAVIVEVAVERFHAAISDEQETVGCSFQQTP